VLWIALDPDSGWIPSRVHHARGGAARGGARADRQKKMNSLSSYGLLYQMSGDPESEAPAGVNFRLGIQKSALDPDSG
jgi:hypothetical protein